MNSTPPRHNWCTDRDRPMELNDQVRYFNRICPRCGSYTDVTNIVTNGRTIISYTKQFYDSNDVLLHKGSFEMSFCGSVKDHRKEALNELKVKI